ncbi:MAG TPA: ATP-grasp domain-containing protein [Pseudonocardia sp.]|nr:ATP-grasp domain-containing protein [Pseudonocardia sp.]
MKLLGLEATQNGTYYRSRYQQLVDLGVDLHVLNGRGTEDFWPADRYRIAGSSHIDDLIATAKAWHVEHPFDGVLTFSESAVTAVAAVAEALGLPGIGLEAARASRNKLLMRRAHARGGAAHPRFAFATSVDEALAAAESFGYPVVVKPTLGAASNFVFRVDGPGELRDRFAQAWAGIDDMTWFRMEAEGLDLGPQGLLVESFLDGDEYLIEALAWDDDVYLGSVVDRVTVEGNTFDDDVHHAPTALSAADLAAVHEVVRAGARAQGLRRSVLHAEVRFHGGRPHLVEIAVRPGGGGLDHMARISAGYDPIAAVRDVARGVRPAVQHYRPTGVHTAAMVLLCGSGRIERIEVPEEVTRSPRLFFFTITSRPGDVVRRPPEGNGILGFLGATGSSLDDALEVATDLAGRVRVTLADVPPALAAGEADHAG